jgi:hypothetical protein
MVLALMNEPTLIPGVPGGVSQLLVAGGFLLVGFLWIRHIIEPGPLLRGESRWRYRHRARLQRFRQWLAEGDQTLRPQRTRGWYLTRLEFALAALVAIIAVACLPAVLDLFAPRFGGGESVPPQVTALIPLSGYAGITFGIWWMRRLYTAGLRSDSDARWRYRDR